MRAIKFRAWDKDERKMLRPPVELKHLLRQISDRNDNSLGGDAIRRQDLEWMQFTGLLDKNGAEIYEGDVIKWQEQGHFLLKRNDYEMHDTIGVVTFEGCSYFRSSIRSLTSRKSISEGRSVLLRPLISNDYEVIGNIYENPELLEPRNQLADPDPQDNRIAQAALDEVKHDN